MTQRRHASDIPAVLAQAAVNGDAFALLDAAIDWLRQGGSSRAAARLDTLCGQLADDPKLAAAVGSALCRWLSSLRIYPTLMTIGIFSRQGFGPEMRARLYERFNPSYKDRNDLRDVLRLLFRSSRDPEWLNTIPFRSWLRLFSLLQTHADENARKTCLRHLYHETLYAVEMLSVWIAAEELDPDLLRLEPKLLDVDSPLVGLKREVSQWLNSRHERPGGYDDAHLKVMLAQCRELVERLRRKGTGAGAGSSFTVAHLLERLKQTLGRLEQLMAVIDAGKHSRRLHLSLNLAGSIAAATAEQRNIAPLWRGSVKMLARSISQNSSRHGEHYITRSRSEYWAMLRSAAGGGVLIALMALLKIHIGNLVADPLWRAVLESLNYGIGFVIIHMLHFTVATKQPAMTASSFAQVVERNDKGRAVNQKLAQLLIDVFRSQSVAVFGNVFVAVLLASLITWGYLKTQGVPLLDPGAAAYQFKSLDPVTRPTLLFAAIAGVWLFCSGIIAGFFDNRADYLNLKMRLREHPLLKRLLPAGLRARLADYLHAHYGAMMGNFCFGVLLGMTGYVGYLTGLPLDIRHVAFSSANLGYAAFSTDTTPAFFAANLLFALLIGAVNLIVSFSITLWVALRSRDAVIDSPLKILHSLLTLLKQKPASLFFPPRSTPAADKDSRKNSGG